MMITKYTTADERRKASNERLKERRHSKKAAPFKTIKAMSTKERKTICDHNLTKGSIHGCQVGGVEYTDCGKCPMATAADMHPLVRTAWYGRMKRIGYF